MITSFGMPLKQKVDLVEQQALTTFQLLEAERNCRPAGRRGDAGPTRIAGRSSNPSEPLKVAG
jgi:hypothetical protein